MPTRAARQATPGQQRPHNDAESSCISLNDFATLRDFCVMDGTSAYELFPQVSLSGHQVNRAPAHNAALSPT